MARTGKPIGRPKVPAELRAQEMPVLTVRLHRSEYDEITRLMCVTGKSRSGLVRSIINASLKDQEVNNAG